MEEKRVFTQDQLTILTANGTPQERIEQGVLLPSERRMLEALEQAQTYLAGRYPQEEFLFTKADHSATSRTVITLAASPADMPQESFAVRIKGEKPPYVMSESHFSDVKRAEVNALVRDVLARMGAEAECDLEIPGLFGDAYDPNQPIERLIGLGLEIPVSGRVYAAADAQTDADAIAEAVLAAGLSGGFRLIVIRGVSLQEALAAQRMDEQFVVEEIYVSLPVQAREVQ